MDGLTPMSQVFQRDRQMRCQKASKRKPPRSNGIRRPLSSACTRLSQLLAPSSASPTSRSTPCGRRPPASKGFVNAQVRYLPATTITELSRTSGRATAARKPDHACPMGIACRPVSTLSVVLTGRLARLPHSLIAWWLNMGEGQANQKAHSPPESTVSKSVLSDSFIPGA